MHTDSRGWSLANRERAAWLYPDCLFEIGMMRSQTPGRTERDSALKKKQMQKQQTDRVLPTMVLSREDLFLEGLAMGQTLERSQRQLRKQSVPTGHIYFLSYSLKLLHHFHAQFQTGLRTGLRSRTHRRLLTGPHLNRYQEIR